MDQVNYFGVWVEVAKSLRCQGFVDRQLYRNGGGDRSGHKSVQNLIDRQTYKQTDRCLTVTKILKLKTMVLDGEVAFL